MEFGRETEMINVITARREIEMEKEGGVTMGIKEAAEDDDDDLKKKGMDDDVDVCPICLDIFTIPCRSNCGHLFCATCILQFWMYRYSINPCKCPLCCTRIVKLEPHTFKPDDDVEVLKKLQQYNGLYISGLFGLLHIVQALPLLMGRIFRVLVDPDCLRCIYYVMRVIGLFLGLLYERVEFEFIRAGGFGIQRMFDLSASLVVAALFLIGVAYRWLLKRRARRLATM